MTYYLTYRPQTIADLDSEHLRETLTALLSHKDIPHAFLFTGPKGLGKTSTARIIAKSVNCEKRKEGTVEPCNTCETCIAITNGFHMDVLEIDGASNRGIDEIRDLREKVKLAPSSAKKKIYIIDEVHMLTTEAFNALLKTIEEPPHHVIFIFCTTEPQKVPATIVSRCFHISLYRATHIEIIHSLQRIVQGESISIAPEALQTIARLADGGFRDAAKILEEVQSLSEGRKEITEDFIENHFYKTTNILLTANNFLSSLAKIPPDTKEALLIIQQLVDQGTDIRFFITQIITRLHGILLDQIQGNSSPESFFLSLEVIQQFITLFSVAHQQTKHAIIPQLPLELAVISWSQHHSEAPQEVTAEGYSTVTFNEVVKKEKNLKVQNILKTQEKEDGKKDTIVNQENLSKNTTTPEHVLENVIYKVKPFNHSLAGLLRSCSVRKIDEKVVTIETAYKFHKEKIMETKNIVLLETAFKELTGKDRRVMIELRK